MKKKILVLYVGGTLGMAPSTEGLKPKPGLLHSYIQSMDGLADDGIPDFVIKEYDTLIDSSQVTIHDWNKIAEDIAENYGEYDGFVILHGTDTLAYTATALSFLLSHLNKPVIVTGAQKSITEEGSDAPANILNALKMAAQSKIQEVCILFDNKLFRANRTTKLSTYDKNAFVSPNYPLLGSFSEGVKIHYDRLLQQESREDFKVSPMRSVSIRNIKITPMTSANEVFDQLHGMSVGILETYGSGHMPIFPEFLQVFEELTDRGTLLINQTQCLFGTVTEDYNVGVILKKSKLISAGDLTFEATFCKLIHLFSCGYPKFEVVQLFNKNLVGELGLLSEKDKQYTDSDIIFTLPQISRNLPKPRSRLR